MAQKRSKKKRKHRSERRRDGFGPLRARLQQSPLPVQKLVVAPRGQVMMSDVLERFIDPYMDAPDGAEGYRKLLTLATMAWNTSLLPEEEQTKVVEEMIVGGIPDADDEQRAGLRDLLYMMIARKQAYFSEYTRVIVDFELTETRKGYHLAVASTVEPEA